MKGAEAVPEPLSICMVTTFYPPYHSGGEAFYLYCLSNELAKRGHRVTVVHCVDSYRVQTAAPPRGEFPHEPGVTVHRLKSLVGRVSPLITYLTGRPGLKSPARLRLPDAATAVLPAVRTRDRAATAGRGRGPAAWTAVLSLRRPAGASERRPYADRRVPALHVSRSADCG